MAIRGLIYLNNSIKRYKYASIIYMNPTEIKELLAKNGDDPIEVLKAVQGYYECPKDADGKRLGKLVGYAGKYEAADNNKKQYVGDVYINFARAEQYPIVMNHFMEILKNKLEKDSTTLEFDIVCGPQMGGVVAASIFALVMDKRYICAEKEITAVKTETMREQSKLVFGRHTLNQGDRVVIMEDVLNNFSTTKETIELIEGAGGTVVGIIGLLNRSPNIENEYDYTGSNPRKIPVIALVRKDIKEYKQDDPFVSEDIAKGNVSLKPKSEWSSLVK
jgi:orotate phosphoribosyltransferase